MASIIELRETFWDSEDQMVSLKQHGGGDRLLLSGRQYSKVIKRTCFLGWNPSSSTISSVTSALYNLSVSSQSQFLHRQNGNGT